ncbi:hypothetical protein [Floridanema evergladense]|uniref:Uncharacterized protein n=1 Tax=Floridaenema evergladense BLCC-F167 TaxID=3153639 RepID=A0ABV4WSL0_9CYAN
METRSNNCQRLHKYVWTLVGVLLLFGVTFPIAYWRVSQNEKFAGTPYKSLSLTAESVASTPSQSLSLTRKNLRKRGLKNKALRHPRLAKFKILFKK